MRCRNCKKYVSGYCLSKELSTEYSFADLFNLRSENGEIQEVIKESIECKELLSDFINYAIKTANELGIPATKIKRMNKAVKEESEKLLNDLSCEVDDALCQHFVNEEAEEDALYIMHPEEFCCKEWE